MELSNPTLKLFHLIGLRPTILPNGQQAWWINLAQVEKLRVHLGKETSIVQDPKFGRRQFSWSPDGPTVMLSSDEVGLAFVSQADAMPLIPTLRLHGLNKESFFWFMVINWAESTELMTSYTVTPLPSIIDGKTYELSDNQGYLSLMNGYCAQWFRKKEQLEQYESSIQELEALL